MGVSVEQERGWICTNDQCGVSWILFPIKRLFVFCRSAACSCLFALWQSETMRLLTYVMKCHSITVEFVRRAPRDESQELLRLAICRGYFSKNIHNYYRTVDKNVVGGIAYCMMQKIRRTELVAYHCKRLALINCFVVLGSQVKSESVYTLGYMDVCPFICKLFLVENTNLLIEEND